MQREWDLLRKKDESRQKESQSIDMLSPPSIDARLADLEDSMKLFDYQLDGVYYPLNNSMERVTSRLDALQQEVDTIYKQLDFQAECSKSIDRRPFPSIDSIPKYGTRAYELNRKRKLSSKDEFNNTPAEEDTQPESDLCTREEIYQIVADIYRALDQTWDNSHKRYDEIYFQFNNNISTLNSCTERMQKEIKAIQRQLANRPDTSASIDRATQASVNIPSSTLIDTESASIREKLIKDKLHMLDSMQEELKKLSDYAYDKLGRHQ